MEKLSFLEMLARDTGCNCLSDLRLQQKKWLEKLIVILNNTDKDKYRLSEWIEVISYLTGTELEDLQQLDSTKSAKEYIIQWLQRKKD